MITQGPDPSDAALIALVLQGQTNQFETLIERHLGAVFAIAMARLRQAEMAEDLAQEVFLRAYLHLRRLDLPDQFGAWVGRVARNLSIDWLRRGLRRSQLIPMVSLEQVKGDVPDTQAKEARATMVTEEESRALRDAVMALPVEQREAVLLHHVEDLPQREIAERLGISQPSVSRLLRQSMQVLRRRLGPALKQELAPLKAPRRAFARTSLLIAAAAGLSGSAKSALAAAGPMGALSSVSAGQAATSAAAGAGVANLLHLLTTSLFAGGKAMATAKGVIVTGAAIAAVAGGVYLANQSEEEGPARAVSSPRPDAADLTIQQEMFALIPRDTLFAVCLPSFRETLVQTVGLLETTGELLQPIADGQVQTNFQAQIDALDEWERHGVDSSGPYVTFERSAPAGQPRLDTFLIPLSDPAAFERDLVEAGSQRTMIDGHELWTGIRSFPEREFVPPGSSLVHGSVALQAPGQGSGQRLVDLVPPGRPSPLIQSLEDARPGDFRVAYDLPGIVEEFGPVVRAMLQQAEESISNPPPNVGMSWAGLTVMTFGDEIRWLLDWASAADAAVLTATPSAAEIRGEIRLHRDSGVVDPEPVAMAIPSLAQRVPAGPALAILCAAPEERAVPIMRGFEAVLGKLLMGECPSALASQLEHEMAILTSHAPGRLESAMAIYPPVAGERQPRRVFLDRRGSAGESAETIVDVLSTVLGRPVRHTMQMGMDDLDFNGSILEWRGTETVEGHEVLHFVHRGPGLDEPLDPIGGMRDMRAPLLVAMGPLGEVHHWLTHQGDLVILTAEPEPTLMRQILAGEGETLNATPTGDVAVRLSLGQIVRWIMIVVEQVNPPAPSMMTEMAALLQAEEEGIWFNARTHVGGFNGEFTLPAADFVGFLGMGWGARVVRQSASE